MITGFCGRNSYRDDDFNAGFTLVELIIGITILAILAAVTVPTLLAFADNQNKEKCLAEAKSVLAYMQGQASKSYEMAIGEKINDVFGSAKFQETAVKATGLRPNTYVLVVMKDPDAKIATPNNKDAWTVGGLYYYDKTDSIWVTWDMDKDGEQWTCERLANRVLVKDGTKADFNDVDNEKKFKAALGMEGYAFYSYQWNVGW